MDKSQRMCQALTEIYDNISLSVLYNHTKVMHLIDKVYLFIWCTLVTQSLQSTRNCVHFYLSLGTVTLMRIAFTSFSMSLSCFADI